MTALLTGLGVAVALAGVWDVFRTLWQPSGTGRLSRPVLAAVWRVTGALGARARGLSGPIGVLLVIWLWAGLVIVGWALVYGANMPEGFSYGTGLEPGRTVVVEALYLSAVTVTTLGYGDITPTTDWLRAAVPLQAAAGFAILTAAVSWVLQVYPALTRRRTLANQLDGLRTARTADRLGDLDPSVAAPVLLNVSGAVDQLRVDLSHYPETYYFSDREPRATLAETLGYGLDLADAGHRAGSEDVRLAAEVLDSSLEAYTADLAEYAGRGRSAEAGTGERPDPRSVVEAFRADHTGHRR